MQIKNVPLDKLKVFEKNPREHGEDIPALVASIKRFGWTNPILVQKGTMRIIAGHGRALAALKAGLKEVPVVELELSEQDATACTIADNKLAEKSAWHIPNLKELLVQLDDGEFDLSLTGFSEDELQKLIDWQPPQIEGDADIPLLSLPAKATTKPGELYLLGKHRLLCGDSSKPSFVKKLMNGKSATVIFTDPPYGVGIGKKNAMLNTFHKAGKCLDDLGMDDMPPEKLGELLKQIFTLWRTVMADNCSVFVCSPQGGGLGMMMMMMKEAGLEVRHILNWVKNCATFSMGHLDYDYQHEPILFTWKKTHKRKKMGAFQTSVWAVDKPLASKEHPTMKPVALPTCAILNHSDQGDVVGDPFLGSGTTLIAAEQTGRICYCMEVEPRYCDVTISRWEKLTGKKATRDG